MLAEIGAVRPRVIPLLGATAAQTLMGASFRVTQHRAELLSPPEASGLEAASAGVTIMATVHPSSILRAPDPVARQRELALFVADLRAAAALLSGPRATIARGAR